MALDQRLLARIRELSAPPADDHDRAVLLLLDDYERLVSAYPEGVTQHDHAAHDMRVGRFPSQSSIPEFLAERTAGIPASTLAGLRDGRLVAVPREPTEAMLTAGREATTAWGTYRLMLTAAPEAPDAQGGGNGQ